ncbi:hypothetical protein L3X38_023989 [Prunus dulcis]|uniref:S-adenosyl-L-methionine-dependent methyltransferases superfamily protein n=1 Tax=Prunus dulcis TaxID=3755 RepID=A0AAD4W1P6_PRUDU|nr:hypothetical protein L3X38_023989 [Prunus dulcis]
MAPKEDNVSVSSVNLEKILSTKGGKGELSYANNSKAQHGGGPCRRQPALLLRCGSPGSFYRQLFPSRFIDLFHLAFSLHWLSQVPKSVLDKRSAAYNKGRVFIHGENESTAIAYKKQFQTDLASFLRSRAKELKKGGSMFLACLGGTSVDPTDQSG